MDRLPRRAPCDPRSPALRAALALVALATGALAATPVTQWVGRSDAGPSPRGEFSFAYDSGAHLAVLFGGASSLNFAAVNGQTWEWDGASWLLADSTGLPPRCDNAMAYDALHDRIVSFGGFDGTYLGDTWFREGGAWSQLVPTLSPAPRADSFMVFDSARGVFVLFGGLPPTGPIRRDTWELDDSTWTQRATGGPPPARWIHRMAYDVLRGVTVMFGGAAASSLLADTWEWDGTSWIENPTLGPSARCGHAVAYDVEHGLTVLFGGQSGLPLGQGVLGDTWVYDGVTWQELPISGPAPRTFVKMAYDPDRRRITLFGGWDGTQMVDDTWDLLIDTETGAGEGRSPAGRWALVPGVPNPFRSSTEIRYELPVAGRVRLEVYDVRGVLVRRLLDDVQAAGSRIALWDGRRDDGRPAASGTYFVNVRAPGHEASVKVVLLRR